MSLALCLRGRLLYLARFLLERRCKTGSISDEAKEQSTMGRLGQRRERYRTPTHQKWVGARLPGVPTSIIMSQVASRCSLRVNFESYGKSSNDSDAVFSRYERRRRIPEAWPNFVPSLIRLTDLPSVIVRLFRRVPEFHLDIVHSPQRAQLSPIFEPVADPPPHLAHHSGQRVWWLPSAYVCNIMYDRKHVPTR